MKYLILNEHKLFAKTILLLLLSFCIKLNAQNLTNTGIMYIGRGDIVSVSGDFANTGTTTFDSTGRFYLKGNWNNSGTFNANRSTIIFNGTNQQLLRGNTTFHNLTISKPTVIATLSSNVTVNDTLNFISGKIQTGSANLIIASGLTVSGAGQNTGWVYGNLQKSIASGSNVSRTFEIGRSNFYTPVEVNFASVITAGDVTAKVTSGDYPMLANATINASRSVNGYYSLSNSSTVFNTALVTFNWMSTDVGSGASSAKFTVGTYNGAGLIKDAIVSPESTSITATSVTAFGDFARGESLVPTLGAVGNFTLFTANGAVGNTGTSHVTGNVGTNIGAITGFGPSNLIGSIHVADSLTAQCATDLQAAYNQLFTAPATNASHAPAFGNNETLNAGVYSIYGAGSVAGNLTLDALGDTNAIFIFKFNGAFTTGAASTINLVNGVTSCNVFWLAEGAISMAASTNMRGTLIANNGAISMGAGGNLEGRMLSTSGAVSIYATAVSLPAYASDTNICTGSIVPTLGAVGNFTLFTANGAVGNTGTSHVTGNVGTNIGAITGFGPSNLIGSIHVADSLTAQCATDLQAAYNQLFTAPATNASHAPAFGNNETLNAGVYSIYGAGSVAGNLTLDALGDTNAIFIFKFNGAFTTGAASTINLVNGVTSCNVFWLAEGAISMAASTNMRGTLIANNGAISMAAGGNLEGRMLSTSGAVSIYATAVSLPACASDTNTWTGALSTAWNDSGNWSEGIPSSCTDINIPSGLVNYPILNAGTGKVRNISLQAGSTVTVLNSTLQISGIAATTGGMLIADSGRIEFKGIVRQVVPAGLISSTSVKDLLISNANGIVLGGPIRVTRSVGFGNVNNSLLSSSGFLTLASTAHNTAFLSDITNGGVNTGNTVSGNVTVERYIPAKRAFRFLTPSVNTTTGIRANWMENTNNPSTSINNNPAPGFGTHISGSGGSIAGFDATNTNNPSLFTFSPDTQLWAGMTSTSALLYAAKGYRVLVRGDRSIDLNNNSPQPTPTILRATGTLVTGTVVIAKSGFGTAGMPPLAAVTNAYSFIGNPYASPVNWSAIMTTDISRTIYIFDPTISGSNERGAYVSYNGVLGVNSNSASQVNYHIQTGQSFFVQATGQNPSITFTEQAKTNIMRSVFRNPAQMPQVKIQLLLPRQLASGGAADGVSAFFDSTFSNEVSSEDSYKFTNQDENICIERNGKLLSIEGRKQVNLNDTLPIKMWQLTQPSYILKIKPENFDATVETWLEDKWLQTTARLYKDSVTMIPFNITADTASLTPYRFRIVFRVLSTLPVQLSSIKAYEQNMGVEVEWTALSENNMNRYEVERSAYTLEFNKIGSVAAKGNASMSSTYSFYDAAPLSGQNFYRIRSVDNAGIAKYSKVVKVELSKTVKEISVYPNPVKGNAINLLFKNIESGEYNIKLISHSGQVVFTEVVNHREGTSSHTIVLNKKIAAGTYILQVSYGGKTETIRVVIK